MKSKYLIIDKLEGFSGIRLKGGKPLIFKPGINLLIGRNGSGKTNLMRLIQLLSAKQGDLRGSIESSYFVKIATASLKKQGSSSAQKFGDVTIVKHSIMGMNGHVKMSLKNIPEEYILKNIIKDPTGFHGNIELICKTEPVKHQIIYGSIHPPKFEMSGHLFSSSVFSREHNNPIQLSMQGPIESVSEFVRNRLKDFFCSDDFISKIQGFEETINKKFSRFFSASNKRIKINYSEIATSGRLSLSLMDNDNYIQSTSISTGESILLNLVLALASAKEENCSILSLDEPDIHMHDDMIRVLVSELSELSMAVPSCIINIASHSTALIEQLAELGSDMVNIITFDNERNVSNSEKDIELINALQRNGVHFSPLMLSKRKNLFIENQFEKSRNEKDFLSEFFFAQDLPNIIPIGNSGNVQDNKSFTSVFEDILRVTDLNSVGIQDGDIWLKPLLIKYLKGELKLKELVNVLKKQDGMYISQASPISNAYFFNCWEIENLYLMDEILPCWSLKNGNCLTKSIYKELLQSNRSIITEQYFDTFLKSITRIRVDKKISIQEVHTFLHSKFNNIEKSIINPAELEQRMSLLVDSIFDNDLVHWVPGKEFKKLLLNEQYTFDKSGFDFKNSQLASQVRKILEFD